MKAKGLTCALATTIMAVAPWLTAAGQETEQPRTKAADTERAKEETPKDTVHRAGDVIGMAVKNSEGESLGEINDIVIDVKSGDVKYLAVSYGGVLGLGDKLFAVPMEAFRLRRAGGESDYFLALAIDDKTLKSAPGFDQENWPDFADPSWSEKVGEHYKHLRRTDGADRGADIDVRAGRTGVSVDIDTNRDATRPKDRESTSARSGKDTIHRVSKITGMTVKNDADKELGTVNDVVIDLNRGKVRYLALSYGGLLGVGDKLFAVPFGAFECKRADQGDSYVLVLAIEEQTLKSAPGFNQDKWPDLADPRWREQLDRHYRTGAGDATRTRTRADRDDN